MGRVFKLTKKEKWWSDVAHYCRYCNNFVTGNGNYCEVRNTEPTDQYAKNPNRCKFFELNPIDAYRMNEKGYKPRKPRRNDGNQITIEDILRGGC